MSMNEKEIIQKPKSPYLANINAIKPSTNNLQPNPQKQIQPLQIKSPSTIEESPDPIYKKYIEEPEDNDGEDTNPEAQGTASAKAAGIQIANTIIGAGILSIPIVMRYLGILLGTLFIIFIAFVTAYSVYLLIRCQQITGKSGYSMFAKITFGSPGSFLVKVIIIIGNFGSCCAYLRIFGDTMQTTVQAFVSPNNFWVTNWHNFVYIIMIGFAMVVFVFQKKIDSLKKVSTIGVIAVLVFVVSVFVLFFYKLACNLVPHKITSKFLLPECNAMECLQSLPTVFLAFTFQFNVFPIYFSLRNKTRKEMLTATKYGVSFCLVMFFLTGLLGFLMFGTNMNDTILTELYYDMVKYKNTNSFIKYIVILISIAFVMSTLMGFPPMFFSLKKNFINSLIFCNKKCIPKHNNETNSTNSKHKHNNSSNDDEKQSEIEIETGNKLMKKENEQLFSNCVENIIILVVYILILVVTILIPKLKIIFHILGATSGNFISFIFPNVFYIRLISMSKRKESVILPYILLIIGCCFLIMSLCISIIKTG